MPEDRTQGVRPIISTHPITNPKWPETSTKLYIHEFGFRNINLCMWREGSKISLKPVADAIYSFICQYVHIRDHDGRSIKLNNA
jgi:hypothetical protein